MLQWHLGYQIQFLPLPKEILFQSLRRYHIYKAV